MDRFLPAEAARELASFRQAAVPRAAALTWMLWAVAFPLASFAVAASGSGFSLDQQPTRFRFALGPGLVWPLLVLSWGGLATGFVWHAFAARPETPMRPAASLALLAVGLPVAVALVWSAVFLWVVVPWLDTRIGPAYMEAVQRAFVFAPSPLMIAGLWMLASSLTPWLGPRGVTRWAGASAVALGLAVNALPLAGFPVGEGARMLAPGILMAMVGMFLYQRG